MKNTVRFVNSIHHIGAETWQQLLNSDNPFLRFEFLAALEDGQCIDSPYQAIPLNSGWIPSYAILEGHNADSQDAQILAIAPVFQKLHSYGEYVFDWGWAEAYERHGLKYYPKLVWAIPFTPSTGPRIISQGHSAQQVHYHQQIAQGLTEYSQHHHFSGWHCLFPDATSNEALAQLANPSHFNNQNHLNNPPDQSPFSHKTMARTSCQFHWFNNRFTDFSHYLEKFTSRKRKNIKKERLRLLESGFVFNKKVGNQITPADIENFYHCYQLTYAKRKMRGYLTLEFFQKILQTMPDQLLLVQAQYPATHQTSNHNSIVANALYFKDADNLYGRYWGCLEEFDSLHFECCYYQGIEYCIEHNISHFDPGTQGEHKISRGFEPTICHSQHWIAHPQFSQAIDDFLKEEQQDIQDYAIQAAEHLPFNQNALSPQPNKAADKTSQ
jgi:predicted N-acyltransferase